MQKMCYTLLHSNQTGKSQLLIFPMPAYMTYTDRDNMTMFDSDRNSGLASGPGRSTTDDSKYVTSITINLTIINNFSWPQCHTFTNKINSKFNRNVKMQIPYLINES